MKPRFQVVAVCRPTAGDPAQYINRLPGLCGIPAMCCCIPMPKDKIPARIEPMSAVAIPTIPLAPTRPTPKRWSGAEFDRLSERGDFDGLRVELIDGEILELPPMNNPHAQAVRLADYALRPIFLPPVATISIQCPMRLGEYRPLPDIAVVPGTPRQLSRHPETALLVIEVSDTTLEFDREKAKIYARHGLPDYWIINLSGRCVEVHRSPISAGPDPRYGDIRVCSETESVTPVAAPQSPIAVADLLP
jgi:Uma2 family endonuclease